MKMSAEAPSTGWPLERLEREIAELAAHIHAATCRWLTLVAEFDRREGWAEWGCKSCAHWLSWRCALSNAAAREQVRVARRLAEMPLVTEAFGRGKMSYSQVRALSRVVTPDLEEELLELARHATAAQLEVVLRAYRGAMARELEPEDLEHGERYVVCEHDDDGCLLIRARLPAEEGALVVAALEAARDDLAGRPSGEGRGVSAEAPSGEAEACAVVGEAEACAVDRSAGARDDADGDPVSASAPPSNADALVLMAESVLSSGVAERSGRDSYQVVVHVDAGALSQAPQATSLATVAASSSTAMPSTPRRHAGSPAMPA